MCCASARWMVWICVRSVEDHESEKAGSLLDWYEWGSAMGWMRVRIVGQHLPNYYLAATLTLTSKSK